MKILHILPAETAYMYSYLKMMSLEKNWEDEHTFFVILSKEQTIRIFPKLLVCKKLNYIESTGRNIDKNFKNMIKKSDKIIWHMFVKISGKYKKYLSIHPNIMKKSYWCMSGMEIEYLQKKEIGALESEDHWLEYFLKKLTIVSTVDLYNDLIQKYAKNFLPDEVPYPYRFNNYVESVLINQLSTDNNDSNIVQFGLSGHVINEHDKILKDFDAISINSNHNYCIPIGYADYIVGSSLDHENISKIFDLLIKKNCKVSILNPRVSTYNYLHYLNSVSEVHIGEIPASAITSLVYLGSLKKKIYYHGTNLNLQNFNFSKWAWKELDLDYVLIQWIKLFETMRNEA